MPTPPAGRGNVGTVISCTPASQKSLATILNFVASIVVGHELSPPDCAVVSTICKQSMFAPEPQALVPPNSTSSHLPSLFQRQVLLPKFRIVFFSARAGCAAPKVVSGVDCGAITVSDLS
jgi:hypothetical protein